MYVIELSRFSLTEREPYKDQIGRMPADGTQNTDTPKLQFPPHRSQPRLVPTAPIRARHRQVGTLPRYRRWTKASGHDFHVRTKDPRPHEHVTATHEIRGHNRPARRPPYSPARRRPRPVLPRHR